MITTADFPALTDRIEEIFVEHAATKVGASVGMDLFGVKETNMLTYQYQMIHGLSGIQEVTPGQNLPSITSNEGDDASWTQRYFGGKFEVTKAMRKFDLYDKIDGLAASLTDDAFDLIDQSFADVLLFGWDTSYTDVYGKLIASLCPDGKTLFHATHDFNVGSRTFSNIINDGTNNNPTLSRAAIVKARAAAKKYKDAAGKNRPINLDTLIVGPDLEDLAERILFSPGVQGTDNVDNNPLKSKVKKLIVWDRLGADGQGTDKSNYWFLADGSKMKETLRALFAERPSLDAPEQVYENKNWEWTLDFFYTIGLGFPAFVYGSKGTNA